MGGLYVESDLLKRRGSKQVIRLPEPLKDSSEWTDQIDSYEAELLIEVLYRGRGGKHARFVTVCIPIALLRLVAQICSKSDHVC